MVASHRAERDDRRPHIAEGPRADGIAAGRLNGEALAENFRDVHPPLDDHEAAVAADRCYFCFDAPCVTACPTEIDIPLFIRQIASDDQMSAAQTIFEQNIMGGMCARVCPTETLCEEACVREAAEGKPVRIGLLQRYATDAMMADGKHPFERADATGKRIAVVGAGPAGLACAHRLAMKGHDVTVFEKREKPGGLNEYGIAAYKTVHDFAQAEVDWLMKIGGITIEYGKALSSDVTLDGLRDDFDAVFLGLGLDGARTLDGADKQGVEKAVDFIARLRQTDDLSKMAVGRHVVVIGGGMTAVDAAVQSKLLGAETVTIAYRRGRGAMPASRYEQDLAASHGVRLVFHAAPKAVLGDDAVTGIELAYTSDGPDGLVTLDESFTLPCDQLLLAIGQTLEGAPDEIDLDGSTLAADAKGMTSIEGVFAGGDCVSTGDDLTVWAVAQGRDAAEAMHAWLGGRG